MHHYSRATTGGNLPRRRRRRRHWWQGHCWATSLLLLLMLHCSLAFGPQLTMLRQPQQYSSMRLFDSQSYFNDLIASPHNQTLAGMPAPRPSMRDNKMATSSSLGDIMTSGLVSTTSSSSLAATFGIHHPLDRILLTANGNLQRLVSSYYDSPVEVTVLSCQPRDNNGHIWDRVVHLHCLSQTFCVATSVVEVHDPAAQHLVASGQVGLGQLFRHYNVLPHFDLLRAGRRRRRWRRAGSTSTSRSGVAADGADNNNDDDHNNIDDGGVLWRDYVLTSDKLTCRIHEEFAPHVWQLDRRT